jgi:sarcosine oxidase subunit gamma
MAYDVTIAPLPAEAMIELRADQASRAALARLLPTGLPEKPNTFAAAGDIKATWLGSDAWLVTAPSAQEENLLAALARAAAGRHAVATLVTDQYAGFRLAGPQCRAVLAQGCALDLRADRFTVGSSARTLVADVTVLIRRVEDRTYDLIVDRSLARHLELWLAYASGRP